MPGDLGLLALGNAQSQVSTVSANQQLVPMGTTIPHAEGTLLTQQQVRQYIESHTFWVGPTVSGKEFTVQTVQLLTAKQAYQEKHADSLGVPLNELVYYVVAVGPFQPLNVTSPHPLNLNQLPQHTRFGTPKVETFLKQVYNRITPTVQEGWE